jgi:hypothetical protein
MIFVYLRNRERVAVSGAASVRHRGEVIVCLAENGEELRRFSAEEVWAYTREDLGELLDESAAENNDSGPAFDETQSAGEIADISSSEHASE